jgi:hypothetical protein
MVATGTIGFKPIYSFSFVASIGAFNASMIRKLVVHSNFPALLTQPRLKRWIDGLGISFDRLKVLAISFEVPSGFEGAAFAHLHHNAGHQNAHNAGGLLPNVPPVLPTQLHGTAAHSDANTTTNMAQHSLQSPLPIPADPHSIISTVTMTTPATYQTPSASPVTHVAIAAFGSDGPFAPLTPPPHVTPTTTQAWTVIETPSTPEATNPNTTPSPQPASVTTSPWASNTPVYEVCAEREKNWLKRATTRTVQEVVNTPNTDLRAGDLWLMYRDPKVRKLPGIS